MQRASKQVIKVWLGQAQEKGCTHLMVVCDDFDFDDYPVFITSAMDVRKEYEDRHQKDMQRVMEVYDLNMDIEEQLREHRSIHF